MRPAKIPLLLMWLALPVVAGAQGPRPEGSLPAGLPGATMTVAAPGRGSADSLPCPECDPPKRFWFGAADLMLMQFIPWVPNAILRDQVWAQVGPQTWKNNLVYPWQWDDNSFMNNQFGHPYHGSTYYNSGRTNGYDFWASGLWSFGGSLMWELFFEAWAPAPNDFVNTSVGGIVLGETLYRLSRLPLDNTATGGERVWREVASGLINPVSGINRLVRGETGRVSATPPDWRPSAILGLIDLGYRQTTQTLNGAGEGESGQWNATFALSYGDPITDMSRSPFSYFGVRADLAGPTSGTLVSQFSARGSLAAWPLNESRTQQFALTLEYDYFNNPAFIYGGQSVQAGLVSTFGEAGSTWWGQTNVLVNGVILGATQSDYYDTVEGRNYDYGPGVGTLLGARFLYKSRWMGTAAYTGLWLVTIDGSESAHFQDALSIEGRFWATPRLGLGVSYTGYNRRSDYAGTVPDVHQSSGFLRAFVSTALPGMPLP